MMDDRSFEALLRESLERSGRPAPFPVDVSDRVMARIALLPAPAREEISPRQLSRWAAAAAVAAASLLALALWKGPTFEGMLSTVGLAIAGAANAALKLVAPAGAVANAFGRIVTALLGSAQTVVQPLAAFQPLARVLLVALTAAMLGITTFIVGRDVRSRVAE
jgi:hypothetical protein